MFDAPHTHVSRSRSRLLSSFVECPGERLVLPMTSLRFHTKEQAIRDKILFQRQCELCHGVDQEPVGTKGIGG